MGSMAEMSPWMTNAECRHRTGIHLWQDLVYTQVCDPETFEPLPTARRARRSIPTSSAPSQPMIRLVSGDRARWTDAPCPCGRTYPAFPTGSTGASMT
jgi:phenylacetate-CoA ligase